MDFVNQLCSSWPEGNLWANLIKIFDFAGYAWAILIFTVVLKLILSPLDFLQRFYTNKTTRMQAKIQPELEKLKKRYGQNQTLLYQKQTELYKKNNFSMKGSCVIMLVYMAVTLTVFLTLFNSLQSISSFKINNQFEELQAEFHNEYDDAYKNEYLSTFLEIDLVDYETKTDEEKNEIIKNAEMSKSEEELKTVQKQIALPAQEKVVKKYEEIKDGWLWVKNIWRSDKPTVTTILKYDDFVASTSSKVSQQEYELVMGELLDDSQINNANGYYILSVLVVIVSFLSQFLMKKLSRPKLKNGQTIDNQQPGFSKILMFVLPFAMLLFTLNSSAMFSIYVVTNSLMTTLITPITTWLSNKLEDKIDKKNQNKNKAVYSR